MSKPRNKYNQNNIYCIVIPLSCGLKVDRPVSLLMACLTSPLV